MGAWKQDGAAGAANDDAVNRASGATKRRRTKIRGLLALAACLPLGVVGFAPAGAQDTAGGTTNVQISTEGRQVYEEICQACHMADAKGGGGAGAAIPALAGNPKLADKDYAITLLLKGRGGMPWFTEILTPEQMAAVVNYVRGHFNDYHDIVTVADVKRVATGPAPKRDCLNACGQ
ncbi:c-type cytochrome [Novosphingobium humi]|uniref:c-type cytochrome n=1 Tax=Novosphingobium humi TaxID=2282397 RepID=UPI0025AF291D|nr:cytochrome c [Novosphingobium humi]WJS99893.1 cytochrome c [Novosphingobium humi]